MTPYPGLLAPELPSSSYNRHEFTNNLRISIDFRVTMAIICCGRQVSHGVYGRFFEIDCTIYEVGWDRT